MKECKYQENLDKIIVDGDAKSLVDTAKNIANDMITEKKNGDIDEGRSVSTSQIRNIYGSSKKIQGWITPDDKDRIKEGFNRLILLKPKMAYANGRYNKKIRKNGKSVDKVPGFKILVDSLSYAIDKIEGDYQRMINFFNFFEAILAYHKAKGGRS